MASSAMSMNRYTPVYPAAVMEQGDDAPDAIPDIPTSAEDVNPDKMARSVTWLELAVSALVCLVLFIVYGTVSNLQNYKIPLVYDVYSYKTSGGVNSVSWIPHAGFNYDIGLTLPFVPLITALGCCIELAMWKSRSKTLPSRNNPWRWVMNSLSTPLLATAILASFGEIDMLSLVSFFALIHIIVLLGHFLEIANPAHYAGSRFKASWSPLVASIWVGLLSWVPFVVTSAVSTGISNITWLDWFALAAFVMGGVSNTLTQISYYRYLSNPKTAMWPFKHTRGGITNYAIYDSFLAASTLFWNNLAILILMGSIVQTPVEAYPPLPA